MAISFGGLVSGLDTDSIIQQLISLEARPISLLLRQKSTIQSQVDAFKDLNTKLAALEDKAFALTQSSNVIARSATSADKSKLVATASPEANVGSFGVEIITLATTTKLTTTLSDVGGQGNGFGGVIKDSLAAGDTIQQINDNNKTQSQITEGVFYVEGQSVTVTNASTLATILSDIDTIIGGGASTLDPTPAATGNDAGQKITLNGGGTSIALTNGTSNFLSVFKLDTSPDGASRTSSDNINGVSTSLTMDDATNNFAQVTGSGTLTINGVNITYNGANDSLDDILSRINASNAGVTASFSQSQGGQFTLTNKASGPLSISVSDTGNLANVLGVGAGGDETLGTSAQIKIDGGPSQFFNTNTGIKPSGLTGITLDLLDTATPTPITVTVNADTDTVVGKAKDFVNQFNSIVDKIEELTKYNPTTNEKGILISDFTVSNVKDRLFRLAFSTVSGLSEGGNIGTLSELGFSTGAVGADPQAPKRLELDETKLRDAVTNTPTRVAQILGAENTTDGSQGIMQRLKNFLDGMSNSTGVFAQKQKIGRDRIDDIDDRINTLNKRLSAKQEFLENKFSTMEMSLINLQSQQSALSGLISSIGR